MTKQTEALKMAIEALESFEIVYGDTDLLMPHNFYKSLQACKEALEQPTLTYEDGFAHGYEAHRAEQALAQPSVAELNDKLTTDEKVSIKRQINDAFNEGFEKGKARSLVASIPPNFIRLESMNNFAPQPAQDSEQAPCEQPVAWLYKRENSSGGWYVVTNYDKEHNNGNRNIECYDIPLYTHPAPQPAQGEVVVTKNEAGQIMLVSRQDSEGNILSVIAESENT